MSTGVSLHSTGPPNGSQVCEGRMPLADLAVTSFEPRFASGCNSAAENSFRTTTHSSWKITLCIWGCSQGSGTSTELPPRSSPSRKKRSRTSRRKVERRRKARRPGTDDNNVAFDSTQQRPIVAVHNGFRDLRFVEFSSQSNPFIRCGRAADTSHRPTRIWPSSGWVRGVAFLWCLSRSEPLISKRGQGP